MSGSIIFLIVSIFRVFYSGVQGSEYEIGCNTFDQVVQSRVFVDKTMMIKEFFQHKRVLITATRRCGKSMNMDMIRRFCEVQVFRNGTRIPKEETDNYKLFTQNNLRIHDPRHDSIFRNHFGEYPVILLNFGQLYVDSFSAFLSSFRLRVHELFLDHDYLLESGCLDEDDKNNMKTIFNNYYNRDIDTLSEGELIVNLNLLTELLHKHFKKGIIVFIDEYDVPIQRKIFEGGNDTEKIINSISDFIADLLKDNPYVERALLTGCVRFSGVFSKKANNIEVFRFTEDHPFNLYYGFTEDEVINLTKKCNCESKMEGIREWYDGYNVANSKIKLYNVWTIVQFMADKILKRYWAEPDDSFNLNDLCSHFTLFKHFISLLLNNQTEIRAIEKVSIKQVEYLNALIVNPINTQVTMEDAYLFLNLMLDLGYVSIVKTYKCNTIKYYSITIPNKEIRREILRNLRLLDLLESKYNIYECDRYMKSILKLGEEKRSYEDFLKNVRILITNFQIPENEDEFQKMLSIIPYVSVNEYSIVIHSQVITPNSKFADLLIYSMKDRTGIVIGVKHSSGKGGKSYEGLSQIVGGKRYYDVLDKYKVEKRIFISIYLDVNVKLNVVKGCSLSYLFNTTDINKAVTLIKQNTPVKWSEERKKAHSERMKEYWRKRKEQQRKKQLLVE